MIYFFLASFYLQQKIVVSFFFLQLEHKATLTLSNGITIFKTLIFALDFPPLQSHLLNKLKQCLLNIEQIFCVTHKRDSDSKEWCFLLKKMVTKNCDTNNNVTKMGVIIMGVYCNLYSYNFSFRVFDYKSLAFKLLNHNFGFEKVGTFVN